MTPWIAGPGGWLEEGPLEVNLLLQILSTPILQPNSEPISLPKHAYNLNWSIKSSYFHPENMSY